MKKNILISSIFSLAVLLISSCNVNKAKVDDELGAYFKSRHVDGCFAMLNNADGAITVYNMGLDTQRFSPASTFKILNSMIALQTGAATSEKMVIKWDSLQRSNQAWNKDMDMQEAFKVSCVPYYQELTRRIGAERMKNWIDSIGYGNKNIEGPIDSFWLNNKLKISPDEQLGFMKRLYFDQLPFRKSVQESVRRMMLQEDNSAYQLSYKTGWGADAQGQIGWVCGWIEENRHVYFFVTLVRSKGALSEMPAWEITKDILAHYDFFKGKK